MGQKWIRPRALLRIYRTAARNACAKFKIESGTILPIFNDPELQSILLRERYTEKDECDKMKALLKQADAMPNGQLVSFVNCLSEIALDEMENSFWWKERCQERVKEHQEKKGESRPPLPESFPDLVPTRIGVFSNSPLPKGFVDRQQDLDELGRWLVDEEQSLFFLGAPAGRGKSYVASKFYGQVRDKKEWQARWIECRLEPKTTLDALLTTFAQEFLREAQENDIEPDKDIITLTSESSPPHNRMTAFLNVLQRKNNKWLFVFDNYHEVEDKEMNDFLEYVEKWSKKEIKVLIVGRERPSVFDSLDLPTGARHEWLLEPLPQEEAQVYLNELGLAVDLETAQKIWRKCAGEPMAMKILVNAACRRNVDTLLELPWPDWSQHSTGWLQRLTDTLCEEEIQVARVLSIFPEPVERPLLDYVCQRPQVVDSLQDRFLLDTSEEERLSLHNLLRSYWSAQLGETATFHARAAEWLQRQAEEVSRAQDSAINVRQPDYLRRAFFHWRVAAEKDKALTCATELWESADDKWNLSGQALALAREMGDSVQISHWVYNLGTVYEETSAYGDAEQCYRESLEIARANDDSLLQARNLLALGRLDRLWRRDEDAERNFAECRRLAKTLGDEGVEVAATRELGLLRDDQGETAQGQKKYEEAEQHYQEALHIIENVPDTELITQIRAHMGYLQDTQGVLAFEQDKYDEAEQCYQEALSIAEEISDSELREQVRRHVGYLRDKQGEAARVQGDYKQVEQFYQEAIKIAEDIGQIALPLRAQALAHLGILYAVQHRRNEAYQHLTEALDLESVSWAIKLIDREVVVIDERLGAELKWYLGSRCSKQNQLNYASQLLTEGAETFESIGDSRAEQVQAELERMKGQTIAVSHHCH